MFYFSFFSFLNKCYFDIYKYAFIYFYIWFKCPKCPLGDTVYTLFVASGTF